jgi:hypothetical protein
MVIMKKRNLLILGDVIALGIITVVGFASHGEAELSSAPRMLTTFLPLLAGWFLIAPWLELFEVRMVSNPKQLWRPVLAMILTAPLTSILRAVMLNGVALPLFTAILGGSAAVGMLVWRGIWLLSERPANA